MDAHAAAAPTGRSSSTCRRPHQCPPARRCPVNACANRRPRGPVHPNTAQPAPAFFTRRAARPTSTCLTALASSPGGLEPLRASFIAWTSTHKPRRNRLEGSVSPLTNPTMSHNRDVPRITEPASTRRLCRLGPTGLVGSGPRAPFVASGLTNFVASSPC